MKKFLIALILTTSVFVNAQTISSSPTLTKLKGSATNIVVATLITKKPYQVRGSIFTLHEFIVEKPLKGTLKKNEKFEIKLFGGVLGDLISYRPGTPYFDYKTKYIIFLSSNSRNQPTIVHGNFGKLSGTEQFTDIETGKKYTYKQLEALLHKESSR
jgi:hypothetical protein